MGVCKRGFYGVLVAACMAWGMAAASAACGTGEKPASPTAPGEN